MASVMLLNKAVSVKCHGYCRFTLWDVGSFTSFTWKLRFCTSCKLKMLFGTLFGYSHFLFPYFFYPASCQQNLKESSSSDDENDNQLSSQKVRKDHYCVLVTVQCREVLHILHLHVCTSSEMFRTSCPSVVQRDRGGSRRRRWPSRLKEDSWRGFTELRYYSSLLDSLTFNRMLCRTSGPLLCLTLQKMWNTCYLYDWSASCISPHFHHFPDGLVQRFTVPTGRKDLLCQLYAQSDCIENVLIWFNFLLCRGDFFKFQTHLSASKGKNITRFLHISTQ